MCTCLYKAYDSLKVKAFQEEKLAKFCVSFQALNKTENRKQRVLISFLCQFSRATNNGKVTFFGPVNRLLPHLCEKGGVIAQQRTKPHKKKGKKEEFRSEISMTSKFKVISNLFDFR